MESPKQFDNITSRVIDDLKVALHKDSKVTMAAASFQLVQKLSTPASDTYLKNFNDFWQDKERGSYVTDTIIEYIENVYRENSPNFIYFVTLYNIFNKFLEDISEDMLFNVVTGFKSSQIWNNLYNFQKGIHSVIINKMEAYNGCILADSLGFGKTFTTISVIKYYESHNKSSSTYRRR